MTAKTIPACLASVDATLAFLRVERARDALVEHRTSTHVQALIDARRAWADLTGLPVVRERSGLASFLRRSTMAVAACAVLAGCVAPHQHAYDQALDACISGVNSGSGACDMARSLGPIVAAEKQEQAAAAEAFASGLLAASTAAAVGYAASQPHYYAPVVVVCGPYVWGC